MINFYISTQKAKIIFFQKSINKEHKQKQPCCSATGLLKALFLLFYCRFLSCAQPHIKRAMPKRARSGIGQFNCPVCGNLGDCGKVGTFCQLLVETDEVDDVTTGVLGICGLMPTFFPELTDEEDDEFGTDGVDGVAGLDGVVFSSFGLAMI